MQGLNEVRARCLKTPRLHSGVIPPDQTTSFRRGHDSYHCFRECLLIIASSDMFHIAVNNFKEGFPIHPIARFVELFVLIVAIWKLVFRGKIRAFLRVNSIVMLFLACLWIHTILFSVIDIKPYPIWN